jgi:hypothetical protein
MLSVVVCYILFNHNRGNGVPNEYVGIVADGTTLPKLSPLRISNKAIKLTTKFTQWKLRYTYLQRFKSGISIDLPRLSKRKEIPAINMPSNLKIETNIFSLIPSSFYNQTVLLIFDFINNTKAYTVFHNRRRGYESQKKLLVKSGTNKRKARLRVRRENDSFYQWS